MAIILRFIWKSIKEKKFRTFLILFSITLSTALFFASNALSLTLENMYMEVMKRYYGTSTIVIEPMNGLWFLSAAKAQSHADRLEYAIGAVSGGGTYYESRTQSITFTLHGLALEDLPSFSPTTSILEEHDLLPFAGAKIIVGRAFAAAHGISVGQIMELDTSGARRRFTVAGIAAPTGLFKPGFDRNEVGIVPREYLADIYGILGRATVVYARTRTQGDVQAMIKVLSLDYPRFRVREPVEPAEREQFAKGLQTPLLLMTMLVLFVSIFIIYSSFKVITVERMPVIGTFRSIGAARKTTDLVLILETLLYGIAGGLLGCLLGLGVLVLMTNLVSYNAYAGIRMSTAIHFKMGQMLFAFLVAVVLSLVSAIVPIVKVSRVPVKDIVLNRVETRRKRKLPRLCAGICAAAASVVIPLIAPKDFMLPVDSGCMILAMAAMIILAPFLTSLLIRVLQRLYLLVFGNEGVLAAKNLRENRSVITNISLLSLSLSSLIMIFTMSFSVIRETAGFYNDARFQFWAWAWQADRSVEASIQAVHGVTGVTGAYSVSNVAVEPDKKTISVVNGVDTRAYLDFWAVPISPEGLARLEDGRNIYLADAITAKLGVRVGDAVTLNLESGKRSYTVIGTFHSLRNNGSFGIVAAKYLRADAELRYYNDLYIKTALPIPVMEAALKKKLERRWPWISSIPQMQESNLQSNQQLFTLLDGFAVMTLVMGFFGVLNNFIISFVERRRYLAIFRSVGMSRTQIVRMMIMESLTGGLIAGVVGCAGGAVFLYISTYLLRGMDLYITVTLSPPVLIICAIASILVSLLASISPALKSGRLNLIESLKYE